MQLIKFELNNEFVWVSSYDAASGWWVARCDALSLTASGETYAEMIRDMEATMVDLFRMLLEEGTLPQYLIERGGQVRYPASVPAAADARFDFPWSVQRNHGQAHAHA